MLAALSARRRRPDRLPVFRPMFSEHRVNSFCRAASEHTHTHTVWRTDVSQKPGLQNVLMETGLRVSLGRRL